jgi:Fuc2NAc and GlcNAc transferase
MRLNLILIAIGCLVASALVTGRVRRFLVSRRQLVIPGERSLHEVPTPQGGGVAIVAATIAAQCVLAALGIVPFKALLAFGGGGIAVAVIGYLDDRRHISPLLRISVHLAAALWALFWLGGLPAISIAGRSMTLGVGGYVLGALGIIWSLNLFNFMDGIDGVAASEATFVALAGAMLSVVIGTSAAAPTVALMLGCACMGFLIFNWPPAKIFMGDVGSGYVGYTIALLVVAAARDNAVNWLVWLILGAVFVVDATLTLARRMLRGERVYEAHRSHAYQRLARRWGHLPVTVGVLAVNLLWLLPCAWLATVYPEQSAWIAIAALTPLVLVALAVGVGTAETPRARAPGSR